MKRQMADMVARAREIGAVQRVWRRLNPERDVRVLYVRTEQWQRPCTRKRHMLKAILNYPGGNCKVKGILLPCSDDRAKALCPSKRLTTLHHKGPYPNE